MRLIAKAVAVPCRAGRMPALPDVTARSFVRSMKASGLDSGSQLQCVRFHRIILNFAVNDISSVG